MPTTLPRRLLNAASICSPAAATSWARSLTVFAVLAMAVAAPNGGCTSSAERSTPIVPLQNPAFARHWVTNLPLRGGDGVASVHVLNEWVVVYTEKGWAFVIKRENGLPVFGVEVPGGNYKLWQPVLLKEYFVFPTTNTLEVYSLAGAHERSLNVRAAIRADCVGERTNVFVPIDSPQGGARVMRFDLAKKDITVPVWELQVWQGGVSASPAVHTDTLYFAADVGTVYAVGAERREPIWPIQESDNLFQARSKILAPLKVDDVGLYLSCTDGHFYCVNRTSGRVKWQYYATGPLLNAPVLTPDTVFVLDPNRGWVAIDKVDNPDVKTPQFNRAARWFAPDIAQVLSSDDKYIYAKDKSNHLVAYDKKTGLPKFQSQRSDFFAFGSNGKGDGFSYSASRGGRIVAIRPVLQPGQTGEQVKADDRMRPQGAVAAANGAGRSWFFTH